MTGPEQYREAERTLSELLDLAANTINPTNALALIRARTAAPPMPRNVTRPEGGHPRDATAVNPLRED
ncbi:hypothetical protein [Actinomadura macra]|uniref:hypothetical protein n=1 Tax=Actinomadura macra TaxID=46164 RepID=UPI00083625BB|nr:hypothetical protein [Actinomadura macra]